MRILFATVAMLAGLLFPAAAAATPVATSDAEYTVLGRVFPDPLGACGKDPLAAVCSPYAQGNVPAVQFIQYQELIDAVTYTGYVLMRNLLEQ